MSFWPGWRTLPGIKLEPLAAEAGKQGHPVKDFTYIWDRPNRNYITVLVFEVDATGAVLLSDKVNRDPIIEDGMLTGFRGKDNGVIEEPVCITTVVVPEGDPPWSPALTVRLPPEQIGWFRRGDTMADGIDLDAENPGGSITIFSVREDRSVVALSWWITAASAASVIALLRERHGEPTAEMVADSDQFSRLAVGVQSVLDDSGAVTILPPGFEDQ